MQPFALSPSDLDDHGAKEPVDDGVGILANTKAAGGPRSVVATSPFHSVPHKL